MICFCLENHAAHPQWSAPKLVSLPSFGGELFTEQNQSKLISVQCLVNNVSLNDTFAISSLKFKAYPIVAADEMELVDNEEVDALDVLPLLPPPGEDVPLIRGADDDVPLGQQFQVGGCFSRQQHNLLTQLHLKLCMPFIVDLKRQRESQMRDQNKVYTMTDVTMALQRFINRVWKSSEKGE